MKPHVVRLLLPEANELLVSIDTGIAGPELRLKHNLGCAKRTNIVALMLAVLFVACAGR